MLVTRPTSYYLYFISVKQLVRCSAELSTEYLQWMQKPKTRPFSGFPAEFSMHLGFRHH